MLLKRNVTSYKIKRVKIKMRNLQVSKGSSINAVTALMGEGVKDFVTTVLMPRNKNRDDEGRAEKCPKLRDVIYEPPPR